MLRLYITRHGETEWNTEGRMQGWKNSNLTDKGRMNAIALGRALQNIEFRKVYCSSLERTKITTDLIFQGRNVDVIYHDDLREMHLGELEGLTQDEIKDIYPEFQNHFWKNPHKYVPKSGEDFYDVKVRVSRILEKIMRDNSDGNVMIVTHGVVLKTIHSYFKNLAMERLWDPPFIYDTSLTIVEVNNGIGKIIVEGDISHLE